MEITKMNKLASGLVEVEFSDGTRAQYREEDLAGEMTGTKPEDLKLHVREAYAKDKGLGKDEKGGN